MKTVFVLFLAVAIFPNCQTSHSALDESSNINPWHRYNNLGDALRIYGSLQVSGTGLDRKVFVRRSGTNMTQPLYILDGFPIGTSYKRANHIVNMQEVKQIKILTSLSQLTLYGAQSHGGVVLINTQDDTVMDSQLKAIDAVRVRPTRD